MPHLKKWEDEHNTIGNFMRYKAIKDYHKTTADIFKFTVGFPEVNFRYLVAASGSFPGTPLNADNSTVTWPVQMMGRLDGENAVKSGEGFYFNAIREWAKSPELQKEHPS